MPDCAVCHGMNRVIGVGASDDVYRCTPLPVAVAWMRMQAARRHVVGGFGAADGGKIDVCVAGGDNSDSVCGEHGTQPNGQAQSDVLLKQMV